ncbi:MAG: hypothetical protein EOO59_10555, partial [Hymenobacter sp.]
MTTAAFTAQLTTALQGPYPGPEAAAVAALVTETLLGISSLQRRMQASAPVPACIRRCKELMPNRVSVTRAATAAASGPG